MSFRRNFFIRSVAAFAGDFAVGFALASACIWMIQSAALGLFLSFLLWLMAIIGGLSISQLIVHPAVQFALSDRKLDQGLAVAADAVRAGTDIALDLWAWSQPYRRLRPITPA
jgi:ABC-type transport system involved in multi-copper enzyme maturation permease subunit